MQIIVLHPRLSTRSITLGTRHVVLLVLAFFLAAFLLAATLYWGTLRFGAELKIPFVQAVVASVTQDEATRKDRFVKENLAAMAVKVGEMQARMMRLDALGERVQGLAGVKPEEFRFKDKPGSGGPETSALSVRGSRDLTMSEFGKALAAFEQDLEQRTDYLNVVETALMTDRIKTKLLPTIQPVDVAYNASGFGWRLDPFNGRQAFHEGIDFSAPVGTPIVAAAGGVVIAAEYHPEYGNMLEIDHGNDIVTRYAHTSKLIAKVGDIVRRGQHVANIGSTGRSTGAHLHFEVLVRGVPQNPHKFLSAGADQARIAALDGKR